jgi:MarR family transcriptional regulator for hemolysin
MISENHMHLPDQTLSNFAVTLTHAARAYRAAAGKVAANYGLSQSTGLPVLVISRFGKTGVRPGVLAETLSLEPPSLVPVVDYLIDAGLVERHEDPHDRRARILRLTAEGQRIAARMDQSMIPFRRKVFGAFDPADVETCLRVLAGLPAAVASTESA